MNRRWLLRSAVLALAFAGGGAYAQEATLICTNAGVQYRVGEFACIAACHEQRRLARCDVVADRASWTYVDNACPSAMIINPPWPTDWNEIPAVAAMSPKPLNVNLSAIAPEFAPRIAAATRRTLVN